MASERKLTVVLAGDASGLSRALGKAESSAGKFGSKIGGIAKTAGLALAGVAGGAVVLGKGFVDAAIESQKITKQTEAVIKSTGGAAQVSAKQVADLSAALSLKSGVDDELIQSGQNVLLTFTGIQNGVGKNEKVFDDATKAALDMSVALGTDMTSASMMIGKALNDPVAGISKLTRSGVVFTDQQKEQIKTLAKNGDVMGAQKIMLAELSKEFGGSAEAQATAGDKLKVAFGNLQEELGAKLLPIVEKVSGFLAKNLPGALAAVERFLGPIIGKIQEFWRAFTTGFTEDEGTKIEGIALKVRDVFLDIRDALKKVAAFIVGKVLPTLRDLGEWIVKHKPVLIGIAAAIAGGLVAAFVAWAVAAGAAAVATIAAAAPFIAIGVAIGAVAAAIYYAYTNFGWFRTAVDTVAGVLKTVGGWIAGTLVPIIAKVIGKVVEWGGKFVAFAGKVIEKIGGVISWVRSNWPLILAILTGPIGLAVLAISRNWDKIKAGVRAVKDFVVARFNDVVGFISGLGGKIGSAASGIFDGITDAFRSAINAVLNLWNSVDLGIHLDFEIPSWVPKVGGKGFHFDVNDIFPDVPTLAQGGIVKHRPGGILANIGEGRHDEAVVPLDGRSLGGTSVVVDLRGSFVASGIEFERIVRKAIADTVGRNGKIPGTNIVKATP